MSTKRREIPEREYEALLDKVLKAADCGRGYGTSFAMVTDDFLSTQCMAEVRYMAWDNAYDCGLFKVDNAGDAILLVRGD